LTTTIVQNLGGGLWRAHFRFDEAEGGRAFFLSAPTDKLEGPSTTAKMPFVSPTVAYNGLRESLQDASVMGD